MRHNHLVNHLENAGRAYHAFSVDAAQMILIQRFGLRDATLRLLEELIPSELHEAAHKKVEQFGRRFRAA